MIEQWLILTALAGTLVLLGFMFYWFVPDDAAYIRRGLGQQRAVLRGGSFAIPGVHTIESMKLDNFSLFVNATRQHSLLTQDPLRVDLALHLLVRVKPEQDSVLTAWQLFAGKPERARAMLEERTWSALHSLASHRTLQGILTDRAEFEMAVSERLQPEAAVIGLEILLISIVEARQTSQLDYQRGESVDAKGLVLLESMRAENARRLHADIKSTELAIKQLDYEADLKKMEWDRLVTQARLDHQRHQAEMVARNRQEIHEIEVAQKLAAQLVSQDLDVARLEYNEVS